MAGLFCHLWPGLYAISFPATASAEPNSKSLSARSIDTGVVVSGIESDFWADSLCTSLLCGDVISIQVPSRVFPEPFAPISKILWLDVSSLVLPSAFGRMSLYFDCSSITFSLWSWGCNFYVGRHTWTSVLNGELEHLSGSKIMCLLWRWSPAQLQKSCHGNIELIWHCECLQLADWSHSLSGLILLIF